MLTSKSSKSRQGSALLIVVAFLAMFTILVLGFLARAAIDFQVSDNSTNLSGGDFFSQGAIDCIVGDLKQEIVDGSTSGGSNVYLPTTNANMDPAFSGVLPSDLGGIETDGLNNVLKVSISGSPFYIGASINRASSITTITPSLDNRSITLADWNKPLLMPATSLTDLTPTSPKFPTPDWIYVARDGTNPGSTANSPSFGLVGNTVNNSNPGNSSYVVGRYAYVIYNEGGLLDVNAAGSPDVSTMTLAQNAVWTRKGSSAFADLTQLPGMTQSIADSIIGWRNLASAGPSANFPTYSFAGMPITNFLNNQIGQTTNWMTTANGNLTTTGQSDRSFTSRQQLISYLLQNVGTTQVPLQYLGTFSRSLNQPSYAPSAARPTVVSLPAQASNGSYSGGNSAFQLDNFFNPILKAVQVTTSFARNDGSIATVGEPLIKKRFALSRLCWLTYKGPSALLGSGDPLILQYEKTYNVSPTLINEGTAANIYKYFGLTWTAGPGTGGIGGFWTYNHGITAIQAGVSSVQLGLLSDSGSVSVPKDILSAKREPDFFELLKAGVCCGAVGKTKTGGIYGTSYSATTESTVTFQILQLGANIITAASPTQYPIWIKYNYGDAGGYLRSFYGSTDLPYFYSDVKTGIVSAVPILSPVALWPPANISSPPPPAPAVGGASITNPGIDYAMIVPTIWDPYDANGPGGSAVPIGSGLAPTQLRITVVPASLTDPTNVPGGTSSSASTATTNSQWRIFPESNNAADVNLCTEATVTANWITENSTAMLFSNVSSLYRQPTVLLQANVPSGSNLQIPTSNAILSLPGATATGMPETGSGMTFMGFPIGTFNEVWNGIASSTSGLAPGNYIFTANAFGVAHPGLGSTIRMEYQAGANWIPYQEVCVNFENETTPMPVVEAGTTTSPSLLLPAPSGGVTLPCTTGGLFSGNMGNAANAYGGFPYEWDYLPGCWGNYGFDPRSTRWGAAVITPGPTFTSVTSSAVNSERPDGSTQLFHIFGASTSGEGWTDSNVGSWVFVSSNMGGPSQNLNSPALTHYSDPDGVVRRAMGGLVSNAAPSTTTGLPMATAPAGASSAPIVLHRPFRSVTELGYVFSDTPWRNIDFFTPESGYSALLDIFCINEDYRQDALVAGKVDLNTRQEPVLQALLAGAYRDESAVASGSGDIPLAGNVEAATVAKLLLARTAPSNTGLGKGPLTNVADLVGHYVAGFSNTNGAPYDGFSADLVGNYTGGNTSPNNLIQRFVEAAPRALSDAGQVGTWNLLIDVVAQSGKCATNASGLASFLVKGERHYWVHVAIDRQTGQVIDENIEPVNL